MSASVLLALRLPVHARMPRNMDITLNLSYAPSVNRIWRRGRHATYKDKKAVAFEAVVLAERYRLFPNTDVLFPAGTGVEVRVILHPRLTKLVAKKPELFDPLTVVRLDIDAPIKTLFDAMQNALIYDNDKQIISMSSRVGRPVQDGGLTVSLTEANWN